MMVRSRTDAGFRSPHVSFADLTNDLTGPLQGLKKININYHDTIASA